MSPVPIPKFIKVTFGKDMRKFKTTDPPTVSYLTFRVSKLFSLDPKSFIIQYKDEDDEYVTIDSEAAIADAILNDDKNALRLKIEKIHLNSSKSVNPRAVQMGDIIAPSSPRGNIGGPDSETPVPHVAVPLGTAGVPSETLLAQQAETILEQQHELEQMKKTLAGLQKKVATNKATAPSHNFEIDINDLEFSTKIGEGSFGYVWKGLWKGQEVAIKQLKLRNANPAAKTKILKEFQQEVKYLSSLRHPNIMFFMGACSDPDNLCIITEFLGGGSLYDAIQETQLPLNNMNIALIARDIARGLNYLHSLKPPMIHRDIKSHNLLLDGSATCKVADFGLARFKSNAKMTKFRGTPVTMAPELMNFDELYTQNVDVFSFGLILWELVTQTFPWSRGDCTTCIQAATIIKHVSLHKNHLPIPPTVYSGFSKLIQKCWNYDPAQRPDFDQVLSDIDEIVKQLENDPIASKDGDISAEPQSTSTSTSGDDTDELDEFRKYAIARRKNKNAGTGGLGPCPFLPKVVRDELDSGTSEPPHDIFKRDPDNISKKFFAKTESFKGATTVKVSEFLSEFITHHCTDLSDDKQVLDRLKFTPRDMYFFIWLFDSKHQNSGTGTVSVKSYADFLRCWGEFGSPLLNAMATFQCPYFHGFLDWRQTHSLLSKMKTGAFLVRMSASNSNSVGVAFVTDRTGKREVTQVKVRLSDVKPSWDSYIAQYRNLLEAHVAVKIPPLAPHFTQYADLANTIVSKIKSTL